MRLVLVSHIYAPRDKYLDIITYLVYDVYAVYPLQPEFCISQLAVHTKGICRLVRSIKPASEWGGASFQELLWRWVKRTFPIISGDDE